jgi:hypothetical protein
MNNYRLLLFMITGKIDYCHKIYHIYYRFFIILYPYQLLFLINNYLLLP